MDNMVTPNLNIPDNSYTINENYMQSKVDGKNIITFINEDKYSASMKRFLYNERIKTDKEVLTIYKSVKDAYPKIKKAFINPNMYKKDNIYVDLSFYHKIFRENNIYKLDKGIDVYFEFLNRIFENKKLKSAGYDKFTIIIPVNSLSWNTVSIDTLLDYKKDLNPFSLIIRYVKTDNVQKLIDEWGKYQFLFVSDDIRRIYFTIDFNTLSRANINKFIKNVTDMYSNQVEIEPDNDKPSDKAIATQIMSDLDDTTKIYSLTGEVDKKEVIDDANKITSNSTELADAVNKAAENNDTVDGALSELDNDEIKKIIYDLSQENDAVIKTSVARASRMNKINANFEKSTFKDRSIKDILYPPVGEGIPPVALNIDSINEEWNNLTFINFNKSYDLDSDILRVIHSFSDPDKSNPIGILSINTESTSTSEDFIETYTVKCEDMYGKRFSLIFDIPKVKDDRFMRLRGNEKVMTAQAILLPCIKTDEDTVQMVSNYNKIFISRYGSRDGKSIVAADNIVRTLSKLDEKSNINVIIGNNIRICSKYELPMDYIDLSKVYSLIETKRYKFIFNQDELREKYDIKSNLGVPYGYDKENKNVLYYKDKDERPISNIMLDMLISESKDFAEISATLKPSTKYIYSKASILRNEIPVIVILGYAIGLQSVLDRASIKYNLVSKLDKDTKADITKDYIKFNDGYLVYDIDYDSSMLMNGIKECDTANFSLGDINNKSMWLEFLDDFGGRILSDGLDNFQDLMMDPLTKDVCIDYELPLEYVDLMLYANDLLCDNKYNRHTDITGNRYRSLELIAAHTYKVLAKAYGEYKAQLKNNRKNATMSIKRSAVIDSILTDNTTSDLSILNPLLEVESANTVSFKGLSGMNSDRSYSLDKRTFDDTMLNVFALSTGFSANVGINRQSTIDMNVKGKRGYITPVNNTDELSVTKTFSMTEALTPFIIGDDPFRTAMTFIQTSKHSMPVKKSMPQLITTGADEALPYFSSDTFAFKAKKDGKIKEKNDDYMIIEYKDKTTDFIDLRERVVKNSDGGFYTVLKLDTDLKQGNTVKERDIIAYHKKSFSKTLENEDKLSYNIATLANVAILTTDEGFEDSTKVSEYLSNAMTSEVVIQKVVTLPKNTNVLSIIKKGTPVQEGDTLITFMNAFDQEDVNQLLKNISDEDENMVDEFGRIPVKSKVTGVVQDINIYRTVEKEELSDSLKKIVNDYEKPINSLKKTLKDNKIEDIGIVDPTYSLETSGKLKNAKDSVVIEFYIKYNDKLGVGDKVVAGNAAKGVVKDLFPVGQEPTSEYGNDKIHAFFSTSSFNARMITSVIKELALGKGIIWLDRKVKDIYKLPHTDLESIED